MKPFTALVTGLPPISAKSVRAEIHVGPGGIEIRSPQGQAMSLSYGEIEAELAGADGSVWLLRSEAKSIGIYVEGAEAKERLMAEAPLGLQQKLIAVRRQRRRFASMLSLIVLLPLIVTALGILLAIWLFPLLIDKAVASVPIEWEEALGEASFESFRADRKEVEDPELLDPLNQIMARLLAQMKSAPYRFELHVFADSQVNAFALPGGAVVVNTGLVAESESPEEVAGVLAHEVQHVLQRHSIRGVVRGLGLYAIAAMFSGSLPASADIGRQLLSLGFDRSQETEADILGIRLLNQAKIDPRGMLRFFERLSEEEGSATLALSFLSTHPASSDRFERLRIAAEESSGRPVPIEVDWNRARGIAKALVEAKGR